MSEFILDDRLAKDCIVLSEQPGLHYLLHGNAEVCWFILVPHTEQTEFHLLSIDLQQQLLAQVNLTARFIQYSFDVDKINIATIGNVVSQLHIHVIGRNRNDAYWPDVVWGKKYEKTYSIEHQQEIRQEFISFVQ